MAMLVLGRVTFGKIGNNKSQSGMMMHDPWSKFFRCRRMCFFCFFFHRFSPKARKNIKFMEMLMMMTIESWLLLVFFRNALQL